MAQSVAVSPRWQAIFSAGVDGQHHDSTAVPVIGESTMVVVVACGSDPMSLKLQMGDQFPAS